MSNLTTITGFRAPSASWSRPRPAEASLVGAFGYRLAVPGAGVAEHVQKRFTMAHTDIDGWPLGPRDGTSG